MIERLCILPKFLVSIFTRRDGFIFHGLQFSTHADNIRKCFLSNISTVIQLSSWTLDKADIFLLYYYFLVVEAVFTNCTKCWSFLDKPCCNVLITVLDITYCFRRQVLKFQKLVFVFQNSNYEFSSNIVDSIDYWYYLLLTTYISLHLKINTAYLQIL